MKKTTVPLLLGLSFLMSAFAATAQSQEVFDLLRRGDVAAAKALIEKEPALIEARDNDGDTPLHYAAHGGSVELINFLIDKGAKLELMDARQKTPLHLAAMFDRKDAVAELLKRGAAIEVRDDYQRTTLILCARERGQAATGGVLIEAGADVNAVDKFGSSALELAAWRGKADFVDLLLEKGARVPESGRQWQGMLSQAASNGLPNLFRRLSDKSQDLKTVDATGEWLLQAAAAGGSAEIVGLLLDKGFDPAKPDRFGWTPLHYAARDGRTDAARILIEREAPLNARTIMGQTAYNVAQERGMEAVAKLLEEKGADKSGIQFPVLEGDYLGQKPPADRAELFGPGIISSIWGIHSTAVFSPDGNEVYWAPMISYPGEIYSRGGLLVMKRVDGRWTPPAWASFSGPDVDDDVPFFSPDGKRLYFISRRPMPGESERGSEKIWLVDRTPGGWSEPRPLDPNVNSLNMHWEFSLDKKGNVYFAGNSPGGLGLNDIYAARFVDGKYEKPVNAGPPINSAEGEESPFIAHDGSYLLFSRKYDLWASFRGADGAWSEPVNLGPGVNSPSIELCPIVTADGKYLFFLSQRDGESHAYWVRADIIDKLRPGHSGSYLGQKPPGMTPEVFAPGIVSREGDQGRLFIAPDGSEIIYWEREAGSGRMRIISILNSGGVWSESAVLPFSEEYANMEPCLSPDGKKMFFVSDRPREGKGEAEKTPDIWAVEKVDGEWGEPRNAGERVNRLDIAVQPFYSVDDKLYFCGQAADGTARGVYYSQFGNGIFAEPVKLDESIFGGQVSGPCVSPDNRTLIVHARKDGGFGNWDLYASFKDDAGNWGELVNLGGNINTSESEAGASFSPDGRFIFFSRKGDIYWVSARVIEDLRK